jgi:acetylornithine deacetylase
MKKMIQRQRLRKLLERLVDTYSPSGKEEDLLEFVRGYLKRRHLPVVSQAVDENRYNLVVVPADTDVGLALIGHLDTVSAYDLDNYGYVEQGDQVKGLGVADMKGGCAAMVEAYLSLWESRTSSIPVALCLVVGEEETGDGAHQLMKSYHFPWAIIGEPTDLVPCLSCYGYVELQLAARGRRLHASLAKRRQNAIEVMLQSILRLTHYLQSNHPEVICNIRDLFSTPAGFAVPERCEAWLDVHVPPTAPIGEILAAMEDIVIRQPEGRQGIETGFRTATIDSGYELPEKGPVMEALKATYEHKTLCWKTQAFRSHSDANQIWAAGVKPIVLGPGQLEQAHTQDESASFEQICTAAEIYLGVMHQMIASGGGPDLAAPPS